MIKSHFKIAFRNLKRNKTYTLINVLGLALGITCTILIFALVHFHLGFDSFHSHTDRIYRITTTFHMDQLNYNTGAPSPLAEVIRNEYNFAEKIARVAKFPNSLITVEGDSDLKKFEEDLAFAEPSLFEILDFPLIKGDFQTALTHTNSAMLTESMARKFFAENDPIGKTIRIDNKLDFIITGILQDLPENTDRKEEIYLSYASLKDHSPWLVEEGWWYAVSKRMQCFVLLNPDIDPSTVNQSLQTIASKYYDEEEAKIWEFSLQSLSDIHFNTDMDGTMEKKTFGR